MAPARVLHARSSTIATSGSSAAHLATVEHFVQLGRVGIGEYTMPVEAVLHCDDVGAQYYMHLPVTGQMRSRHGGADLVADAQTAAVFSAGSGPFLGRWPAGTRSLCVSLDAAVVHDALTGLTGEGPIQPFHIEPAMVADHGYARTWIQLLMTLSRRANPSGNLLTHPLVAGPLMESMINGFLLATRHQYSAALDAPVEPARPVAVRTAIDLIEDDPARAWTVASLARECGVSARTLQNGFRNHVGRSPTAYLRTVRLRYAHEDLLTADPFTSSVTTVARQWGFAHLGRFAAAHLAAYGQSPLVTLRTKR
jgi:AraC-like DNA-binding protein